MSIAASFKSIYGYSQKILVLSNRNVFIAYEEYYAGSVRILGHKSDWNLQMGGEKIDIEYLSQKPWN